VFAETRIVKQITLRNGGKHMRLRSFLMGGIIGAAAVVYMNRYKSSMMFSNFSNAGQSMSKMMDKAKSKFSSGSMSSTQAKDYPDLNKVDEIVNHDSHLKDKVNEILAENEQDKASKHIQ